LPGFSIIVFLLYTSLASSFPTMIVMGVGEFSKG